MRFWLGQDDPHTFVCNCEYSQVSWLLDDVELHYFWYEEQDSIEDNSKHKVRTIP